MLTRTIVTRLFSLLAPTATDVLRNVAPTSDRAILIQLTLFRLQLSMPQSADRKRS